MSKKTEILEIRVSPELKTDLAARCRQAGQSMSEAVRGLIETDLGQGATQTPTHTQGGDPMALTLPRFPRLLRAAIVAVPVVLLSAVYLMSAQTPASASAEFRVFFTELDANADGEVTRPEVIAFLEADDWRPDAVCGTDEAEADEPCTLEAAAEAHLLRADADGDGAVSYVELEAMLLTDRAEEFHEMDLDNNGFLTGDEIAGGILYWYALDAEAAMEDEIVLTEACSAQLLEEEVDGIAELCGFGLEARILVAEHDANLDGRVTLIEYLER